MTDRTDADSRSKALDSASTSRDSNGGKEISLLDIAIVLARNKRVVLGLPFVMGLAAFAGSYVLPNWYAATARILPPQQQSSSAAMLSQLGPLAGLAGASLGIKNQSDLYIGMLKSRTIADAVIQRFDLMKLYDEDTLYDTRKELDKRVTIASSNRENIIAIEVEDKDPKRAASMANAYVEELNKLTKTVAVTEAAQRRVFFEQQLVSAKEHLADAEMVLRRTQESTGLIKLDDQGKAIIENVARLLGQVAVKEVQLTAMRSYATSMNPDLIRVQQELAGLRDQLARVEKERTSKEGNIFVPTGKVPAAGLEYLRNLRDVKYHETIFELIAKQYELAKIDEAKEGSIVQFIDRAVEPDKKSRPRRILIASLTVLVSLFLAVAAVFVKEVLAGVRGDSNQTRRLDLLWHYLFRPH